MQLNLHRCRKYFCLRSWFFRFSARPLAERWRSAKQPSSTTRILRWRGARTAKKLGSKSTQISTGRHSRRQSGPHILVFTNFRIEEKFRFSIFNIAFQWIVVRSVWCVSARKSEEVQPVMSTYIRWNVNLHFPRLCKASTSTIQETWAHGVLILFWHF